MIPIQHHNAPLRQETLCFKIHPAVHAKTSKCCVWVSSYLSTSAPLQAIKQEEMPTCKGNCLYYTESTIPHLQLQRLYRIRSLLLSSSVATCSSRLSLASFFFFTSFLLAWDIYSSTPPPPTPGAPPCSFLALQMSSTLSKRQAACFKC